MFENRVFRRIFGPKRDQVTDEWRKLDNEELNDLSLTQRLGDKTEKNEMGGACSVYGGEAYTGFWWGNMRDRDHLRDPGIDGTPGSGMWGYKLDRAGSG